VKNRIYLVFLFFQIVIYKSNAQSPASTLDAIPICNISSGTVQEFLDHLEIENNIVFSYNAKNINLDNKVILYKDFETLSELVTFLFDNKIRFKELTRNKIILLPASNNRILTGVIRDARSGESLTAAQITRESGDAILSNDAGYFVYEFSSNNDTLSLEFSYLGFKTQKISIPPEQDNLSVFMETDNSLPDIIITSGIHTEDSTDYVEVFISEASSFPSLLGEKDVLNTLKKYPGIISGGEAQNGLFVRGGGNDQNLILLDGVPIYEFGHMGGISSILVNDAVKSTEYISSGFPSKYGGRLSSVVDIKLKDGNSRTQAGTVQASLLGIKASLEGPIEDDKTTYSLAARYSWFDLYLNPILESTPNVLKTNMNYEDLLGKFTHYFSPSNKLSIMGYRGSDRISISQSQEFEGSSMLSFRNDNNISWGNDVINLDWSRSIGSRYFFQARAYYNRYASFSNGTYTFDNIIEEELVKDIVYDEKTQSGIKDIGLGVDLSVYVNNNYNVSMGAKTIFHNYQPSISQTQVFIADTIINNPVNDLQLKAQESYIYVDNNVQLYRNLVLSTGFHLSFFSNEKTYISFQPRFQLDYYPSTKLKVGLSASKMTQNTHLLSNPSAGLPTELWVPSTSDVRPQDAYEISLSTYYKVDKSFNISLSGYYKKMNHLIDFDNNTDLFIYILNNEEFIPDNVNTIEWEQRVATGEGRAYGLETYMQYNSSKFKTWFSYGLGKSERKFIEIQGDEYFPYRFDYRHDINTGLYYVLNSNFTVSLLWTYNVGQRTTIANSRSKSPIDCTSIINLPDRNNRSVPAFHHMDVNVEYKKNTKNAIWVVSGGVYNIYNRYNPYYLYLLQDQQGAFQINQLSIFPILPQLSVEIQF